MNGRRQWLRRLWRAATAVGGHASGVGSLGRLAGGAGAASVGAVALPPAHAAQDRAERPGAETPRRGRQLQFPRDHGAHTGTQIEWWYLTGSLAPAAGGAVSHGFQVTFFRSRTGLAETLPGRFAPRQLLFAHAALTELAAAGQAPRHLHDQRIARWDGRSETPTAHASLTEADVAIQRWVLQRDVDGTYRTRIDSNAGGDGFALDLKLAPRQPLLLQGDRGFSRKGPLEAQASHYYSEPQLAVSGSLRSGRRSLAVSGTAWLDHEWSDSLLPPEAEGWDWMGMNLFDGSALTAFRLRRALDGSARVGAPASASGPAAAPGSGAAATVAATVWAGGSFRSAGGSLRSFNEGEVHVEPGRLWASRATGARYPVEWRLQTPAGAFTVRSLLDGQELDGSASNGAVYWEGLSELLDTSGRRVGLGYLEMTGYASRLRLNP